MKGLGIVTVLICMSVLSIVTILKLNSKKDKTDVLEQRNKELIELGVIDTLILLKIGISGDKYQKFILTYENKRTGELVKKESDEFNLNIGDTILYTYQ